MGLRDSQAVLTVLSHFDVLQVKSEALEVSAGVSLETMCLLFLATFFQPEGDVSLESMRVAAKRPLDVCRLLGSEHHLSPSRNHGALIDVTCS